MLIGHLEPPVRERIYLVLLEEGVKLFSQIIEKYAEIWPPEMSKTSVLNKIPTPLALFHDFMPPFDVLRALIAHRFWYGCKLPIRCKVPPTSALAIEPPPLPPPDFGFAFAVT